MKILFSLRNLWYVKFFEGALEQLARRGHTIHVALERNEGAHALPDWVAVADRLRRAHPSITFGPSPRRTRDDWLGFAISVRLGLDYLRFVEPRYAAAPRLRKRAEDKAPGWVRSAARLPGVAGLLGRQAVNLTLRAADSAVPPSPDVVEFLEEQRPDLVLLSPLLTVGSTQLDVLHAARAAGLRTALCVASWDHLSSKARVRLAPDRVLVWNDTQAREATELHGLTRDRIVVTGAQCFDQWFDRTTRWPRRVFGERAGLPDDAPFILYVCSSLLAGSPPEAPVVQRWIAHVRGAADASLRNVNILVRPHPKRWKEWEQIDPASLQGAVVWPRGGAAPFTPDARDEYFDSMAHSAAVVGINTSALIEGTIAGRPVHTILLPEMTENQEGTLHFHYLLEQNGGPLTAARTFDEHVAQLAGSLGDPARATARHHAFITSFVRADGPATDVFVAAVERMADVGPAPALTPAWGARVLRPLLHPIARRAMEIEEGDAGEALRDARRYQKGLARASELERKRQAKAERVARKVTVSGVRRSS